MNKKRVFVILAAVAVVLGACFSPWKGDEGTISIRISDESSPAGSPAGGPAGGLTGDRKLETTERDDDFIKTSKDCLYTITLSGPGPELPPIENLKYGETRKFSVMPGLWTITITAYLDGKEYAAGSASVNIKPGPNPPVTIPMRPKTEEKPVYTVTFNSNGGIGTPPVAQTADADTEIILPDGSELSKDGYTFGGWNIQSDGSGKNYFAGASYLVTQTITLYAKWNDVSGPTNFTVTFNVNYDDIPPFSYQTSAIPNLSLLIELYPTILNRGDFTFAGWNTEPDGTGDKYEAGDSVTRDITLYAQWNDASEPTPCTVHFNANGGSGTPPVAQTVNADDVITLPDGNGLGKADCTFDGWNTDANGMGENYAAGANYTVIETITLYAKWEKQAVPTYTVTFDSNGGSAVASIPGLKSGATISKPADPAKTNYDFIGWFKDNNTSAAKWDFEKDTVTKDITLYAQWKEKVAATYIVTFNINYGSINPISYLCSTIPDLEGLIKIGLNFTRPGFTFAGWNTQANGSGKNYAAGNVVTGNISLYAQWNDASVPTTYTVRFDANGGSGVEPPAQTADAGTGITLPDGSGLSKAGCTFDGWNTKADGSGTRYAAGADYTVRESITLYAQWIEHISLVEITVIGPETGKTPHNIANGTGNFDTSNVSWQPLHNVFKGSTQYIAEVTLKAHIGSTFTDTVSAKINGYDATVTENTGTTVTLSYRFGETFAKAIKGISVETSPKLLTYAYGDTLNLDGLVVLLTFDDGTDEEVALADFKSHTISVDPPNGEVLSPSEHNKKDVVVKIGEDHSVIAGTLTVNKATPPPITFPTAAAITYGAELSTSALTGNSGDGLFEWQDGDIFPTVINQGYAVVFTPRDTNNYDYSKVDGWNSTINKVVRSVSITVNKANPVITWPTAPVIFPDKPLSASDLTGGSSTPSGDFTWTDGTIIPPAGNSNQSVTFTPKDTVNYNIAIKTISITVHAVITITLWVNETDGKIEYAGMPVTEPIPISGDQTLTFDWKKGVDADPPPRWYVGGSPIGTGPSITISAKNYNSGTYQLMVMVYKNSIPYSAEISFEVQ